MVKLLPIAFLLAASTLFGISWIVIGVDPEEAPWYIFILFLGLLFTFIFNFFGLLLYFLRTKFIKNFDRRWYIKTSFKMAFFVAVFITLMAMLAILKLATTLTLIAAFLAIGLLAVWVYLGKKN